MKLIFAPKIIRNHVRVGACLFKQDNCINITVIERERERERDNLTTINN